MFDSMFFRTNVDVPVGAEIEHALLSRDESTLQVNFRTYAETKTGRGVFVNTQVELPLEILALLTKVVAKLEEIAPEVPEGDYPYLDAHSIADLRQGV